MAFGKKKEEQKEAKVVVAAPTTEVEKFKRLFAVSTALDKKYETTNSVIRLGAKNIVTIPSFTTNLPTFDEDVMGVGGIPVGRVVEFFGPESAGKTSFTLWVISQAQQKGKLAAFVDAEHSLDPGYALKLGVDVDKLLISQPDHGEQALDIVRSLVESKCVDLIVVDSVAALVPEAELLGQIGDNHVGLQPRMMAQALRILTGQCDRNHVTLIFINQIREKIGVLYGNPETTPGGRALKHYASVRVDIRRREEIKEASVLVGHEIRLKAVKNKVGTPLRETVVDLYYPSSDRPGFDTVSDTIAYAATKDLFEMSGSYYSMDLGNVGEDKKPIGVERLANGLKNLKERLKNDKKAMDVIRKKLVALRNVPVKAVAI
jgi:recombination protein RecA